MPHTPAKAPATTSARARAFVAVTTAMLLAAMLPVATAAEVGKYYQSSGSIDVLTPVGGNNYQLYQVCPVGTPTACAKIQGTWNEKFLLYRFTVAGHEPGVGVDWILLQFTGSSSAGCDTSLQAPDGQLFTRFSSDCRPYFQSNGRLPAGTYTLRIDCYCGSTAYAAFNTITVDTGYHGWEANFEWRTSHGLVPPRAQSPQPRVCFDFHVAQLTSYDFWYRGIHVKIDLGDGEIREYDAQIPEWESFCHVYDIPIGPALVCLHASDALGRSASECKAVDRGISVS